MNKNACTNKFRFQKFKEEWKLKYFVSLHNEVATCVICLQELSVLKEFNMRRHFNKKHATQYNNEFETDFERAKKLHELELRLLQPVKTIQTAVTEGQLTEVSYIISYKIAKKNKSFSDSEFIKECIVDAAKLICPEKMTHFQNLSLSRRTVVRRIENIASHLCCELKKDIAAFDYFSIALDESCDIKDTAQLLIFIRGITKNFAITEELAALRSMKGTTTGEDIFKELEKSSLI
jgi:hypothetical protein